MSQPQSAEAINRVTSLVIGAAIEVHRALGAGLLESAYLACVCYELSRAGLRFEVQKAVPLVYHDVRIDCAFRADLIVEGCVVIEVKATDSLTPSHIRQIKTYLRLTGCPVGLILNFGEATMKAGVKRFVNQFPDGQSRSNCQ